MKDDLGELADALRERLTIIADNESRQDLNEHMVRLQNVSERIETLEKRLGSRLHPQLRHFLQRRSYSKALEYLEASPLA